MGSFQVTAPHSWWEQAARLCSLSVELSREESFLSCVLLEVGDDTVILEAESALSTTYICSQDADTEGEGEGRCLIPAVQFLNYIKIMPSGEEISVSYDDEQEKITFHSHGDDVTFIASPFAISNEEAVPHADSDIPEDASSIVVDAKDLSQNYRIAASMAKIMDKEALAGQDPLSGCTITIADDGLQMFSLMTSAAETLTEGKDVVLGESATLLSAPDITQTRLAAFPYGDVTLSIHDGKRVFLSNDEVVLSFPALNTGNMKTQANINTVHSVLQSIWMNRVVSVQVPSGEFFGSLSRVSATKAEDACIEILSTEIVTTGRVQREQVFRQSIPATIVWLDIDDSIQIDPQSSIQAFLDIATVKKIASAVSKHETLHFDIACKNDGSPWALLAYRKDTYTIDDPHNFFMITLL